MTEQCLMVAYLAIIFKSSSSNMIFPAAVILVCAFLTVASSNTVHINAKLGKDGNCSITSGTTAPCRTLAHAYTLLQGQSEAIFKLETGVELHQQLTFHRANVTFQAVNSEVQTQRISCHGYGGLLLTNCSSFVLSNIEFYDCKTQDNATKVEATILITSSTDITMTDSNIFNSSSSAIMLRDCYGNINLTNMVLGKNGGQSCCPKAGGLNIEKFFSNKLGRFNIKNCTFSHNGYSKHSCNQTSNSEHQMYSKPGNSKTHNKNFKDAGGMSIFIAGNKSHDIININDCNFMGNRANWGGGLHVYSYRSNHNTINVINCIFMYNEAHEDGGGLSLMYAPLSINNSITFENVHFKNNFAQHGGAMVIKVSKALYHNNTRIVFKQCTWENNIATYLSPAIDISRFERTISDGYFPIPLFQDVSFTNNTLQTWHNKYLYSTHRNSHGVFLTTEIHVHFSGHVTFTNNYFSALQAVSSNLVFYKNTTAIFVNNRGINGAAIALLGLSKLYLYKNTKFEFINNTASGYGGGILYNGIDQHDFFGGTECFIKVKAPNKNVFFHFHGNEALQGSWIFADSFVSCQCAFKEKLRDFIRIENVLNCIGHFNPTLNQSTNLITSSGRIFETHHLNYSAIPGEKVKLKVKLKDDFGNELNPLLKLDILDKSCHNISLAENFTITKQFHPKGPPLEEARIQVLAPGIRHINYIFYLRLQRCPPGFVYNSTAKICLCGHNKQLAEILSCNMLTYQATVHTNYWVGYMPGSDDYDLYFAPCYSPICNERLHKLPKNPDDLNDYFCRNTSRRGIMCGQCIANHTVYYHSPNKICKPHKNCRIGPLIYICSEILPVFLLFIVIVMCNLSFTSGKVVGLIFLVQYIGGNLYVSSKYTGLPQLIYGIFNLELLYSESLSFCLWESMDFQDIIAVKYVTILFAFALVVILILLLKTNRFVNIVSFKRPASRYYSFIHGLSAFLVICYIQCTKTSFQILQYTTPVSMNGKHASLYTYYGGQPYFKGKHLYYSIIALFNLLTVTFLAPCLLLLHPLLLNLLSHCHLSEHRITLKLYRLLHMHKVMPFIDCFQSCYKDKYRFFAGLYFVYRVALILCTMLSNSYNDVLLYTQLLLLLFLIIHCTVNPYKKSIHNSLDSMAFGIMSCINFLSILMDKKTSLSKEAIGILYALQVILVYLPLLACVVELTRRLGMKLWNRNKSYTNLLDADVTDRTEEEDKRHRNYHGSQELPRVQQY